MSGGLLKTNQATRHEGLLTEPVIMEYWSNEMLGLMTILVHSLDTTLVKVDRKCSLSYVVVGISVEVYSLKQIT